MIKKKKIQIIKIKNEKWAHRCNATDIIKLKKEYYEQLHATYMTTYEMYKSLKRQKLPKLTEDKREHLNTTMSITEIIISQR